MKSNFSAGDLLFIVCLFLRKWQCLQGHTKDGLSNIRMEIKTEHTNGASFDTIT